MIILDFYQQKLYFQFNDQLLSIKESQKSLKKNLMTYFQKKHRPSNSVFSNKIEESSTSGYGQESLTINSNIFNKMSNSNQSQKNGYTQNHNNQGKDSSPISYLKNFKKSYSKANQQNIQFGEPIKQVASHKSNKLSMKKQYDAMVTEIIRGQHKIEDNKSTVRQTNMSQNMHKSKNVNVQKTSKNNRQNQFSNHPFLNDNDEQSMQQMLNSSINQFQRFLQQQREHETSNTALYEQNMGLKKTLSKFKSILKQKLQHGLNKQKQEMKNMLSQYVDLITKLLHDKQELSAHIQSLEEQVSQKSNQIFKMQNKVEEINNQKDEHIYKTKQQIDEFLMVIQQFQNQAKQENQKFQEMEGELERLRPFEDQLKQLHSKSLPSHKNYSSSQFEQQQKRIQTQSQKIQTLLQLLQKSQQQTNTLKEILSKQNAKIMQLRNELCQSAKNKPQDSGSLQGQQSNCQFTQQQIDEIKVFYEQRLQQLQIEHEEEFIEYQKAIKQTINKKDECIERLNYIISQLRQGKKNGARGRSIDDVREKTNARNPSPTFTQQNIKKRQPQPLSTSQNTFGRQQYAREEQYAGY